jgi:hypothetical protein
MYSRVEEVACCDTEEDTASRGGGRAEKAEQRASEHAQRINKRTKRHMIILNGEKGCLLKNGKLIFLQP